MFNKATRHLKLSSELPKNIDAQIKHGNTYSEKTWNLNNEMMTIWWLFALKGFHLTLNCLVSDIAVSTEHFSKQRTVLSFEYHTVLARTETSGPVTLNNHCEHFSLGLFIWQKVVTLKRVLKFGLTRPIIVGARFLWWHKQRYNSSVFFRPWNLLCLCVF